MGSTAKRLFTFGAGLALKKALIWPFDYVLYPVVIVWLGSIWGGSLMIVLAAILSLATIRLYDWAKTDWLLIETLKGLKEGEPVGRWQRLIKWTLRRGEILTFFLLCFDDPITVVLYMRHGSHQYNGMSRRDWKIFIAAIIVSNLYWIGAWSLVIKFAKLLIVP